MLVKKNAIILLVVVFLLTAGITYFLLGSGKGVTVFPGLSQYTPPKTNGDSTNGDTKENEARNQECPLNGEMLTNTQKEKWEKRRPLGVMIENHEDARPQSGLSAADIIYEAVAEGGIPRFLTIFYCKDASYIGPVRSARIYFIKALQEYGSYPLYAHVGGANTPGPADALGEIKDLGWGNYNDLNQFAVPFPYYWRDYERLPGRVTEHTVYSATNKLWEYAKNKRKLTSIDEEGKKWDASFTPWTFKNDATTSGRGAATSISFGFWNLFAAKYSVNWVYSKTENSYKRENGGTDHIDKNTGKPIKAKNVVIIFTQESSANDGYPGGHLLYKLTGTGEGILFQDGKASEISWSKKDEESRMKFTDENGKDISFVRGQIFVEILPIGNKVTY